jgi:REP element-mobilizing transposase RayT
VKPRPILPQSTYLITRRTTQRLFLLRPSRQINACIRYCLALAQRRSGVEVHSAVFLSNHYHLVVTDPEGTLPIFTEELNKLVARSLNCLHGRWENFWSGNTPTSYVRLESAFDVLAKTVYALANPTEALLVSHGSQWPGVRLFRRGEYRVKKPKFFFQSQEQGGLPDRLNLRLTSPPIDVPANRADDVVKAAASAREQELRRRAYAAGKKFMGAAAVKAQRIDRSPKSSAPRRALSPRLACRDKWRRIEILRSLNDFVVQYDKTRRAFLAGVVDALFPPGTYRFVRQFGARCAEV